MKKRIVSIVALLAQVCISQHTICSALYEEPDELPITVIIPSYNNELYCKDNLASVFKQHYGNFRVIYINDASTDGTGSLVEQYVHESGMSDRVTIIHNEYNRKALMNIYQAVHLCDDNDLIVVLDGDDQFAHEYVLKKFNRVHADGNIWLSYAQYINWPPMAALQNKIPILGYAAQTPQDIIDAKNYRWCYQWFWSGLRAFRAWCFKCIKIESLIVDAGPCKGKLLPIMYDAAIMWPMMEMGGTHTQFIPDIFLTRTITPLNDFQVSSDDLKKTVRRVLRNQKVYPTLHNRDDAAVVHDRQENRGSAVLLISHSPDHTRHLLDFMHTQTVKKSRSKTPSSSSCCVLCNANTDDAAAYAVLAQQYSTATFLGADTKGNNLLSGQLSAYLQSIPENHVVVLSDAIVSELEESFDGLFDANDDFDEMLGEPTTKSVDAPVDSHDALYGSINELERTYAYALYFGLNSDDFAQHSDQPEAQRPFELLNGGLGVWQFKCCTPAHWQEQNVAPVLYRVSDLVKLFKRIPSNSLDQLIDQWKHAAVEPERVGLFYAQ